MKQDILENNNNPFAVPEGYFDTLQERIMNRIQDEEKHLKTKRRIFKMTPFRTLVAAAACILIIFTVATIYTKHSAKELLIAEYALDEDFYTWLYASDESALLAESLDIMMPNIFTGVEIDYSEEDEAIIRFLERNNINMVAILHSVNNETFFH